MLRKTTIIMAMLCLVSCPGHQSTSAFLSNDYKKIYKTSICDENRSFPQMIIRDESWDSLYHVILTSYQATVESFPTKRVNIDCFRRAI